MVAACGRGDKLARAQPMLRIFAPALRAALGAVLACAIAACAPIPYAGDVARASDAVDAARAAQADILAPYWWTRAVEYLRQAREVAAHGDFAGARRFGRIAADAAIRAATEARLTARSPALRGRDPAPAPPTEAPIAPARDLPPARVRP